MREGMKKMMMHRAGVTVGVVAAAILAGGAPARAQNVSHGSVDAGVLYSFQGGATPPTTDPSFPQPGIGGSAFGLTASGTVALATAVDVGAELSVPARFDAIQTSGGTSPFAQIDNQHRDSILSALVRIHPRSWQSSRVRVDAVGGFSFVWEDTLQQTEYGAPGATAPSSPHGPQVDISRTTKGVMGGVGVEFPLSAHLSVVPEARFYWIAREDPSDGTPSALLGLSPFVFRAAATLRVSF